MCGGRNNPCEERYISRWELRQLFPVSDMTIWRWQHDPQIAFPAPVKLGINGRNFWWFPAIRDWERRRRELTPAGANPPTIEDVGPSCWAPSAREAAQ
jgi:predicted DNA-binding transcriptional regulator AlpA